MLHNNIQENCKQDQTINNQSTLKDLLTGSNLCSISCCERGEYFSLENSRIIIIWMLKTTFWFWNYRRGLIGHVLTAEPSDFRYYEA